MLWTQRRGQLGFEENCHPWLAPAHDGIPAFTPALVSPNNPCPWAGHTGPQEKGVASFRGFSPEQLPLVRQLYLKPVRRGEVQCRQQFLHLLLVAQPSVDNPKLFIHTEALVVPGQEVEAGAEVRSALGWVISLHFSPSHYHFIY